jgi:hypothetical protein
MGGREISQRIKRALSFLPSSLLSAFVLFISLLRLSFSLSLSLSERSQAIISRNRIELCKERDSPPPTTDRLCMYSKANCSESQVSGVERKNKVSLCTLLWSLYRHYYYSKKKQKKEQ